MPQETIHLKQEFMISAVSSIHFLNIKVILYIRANITTAGNSCMSRKDPVIFCAPATNPRRFPWRKASFTSRRPTNIILSRRRSRPPRSCLPAASTVIRRICRSLPTAFFTAAAGNFVFCLLCRKKDAATFRYGWMILLSTAWNASSTSRLAVSSSSACIWKCFSSV